MTDEVLWHAAGLPTPRWTVIAADARGPAVTPRLPSPLPVVVKPNREGSSVGVSIVRRRTDLGRAVRLAARSGADVLIEEYVPGAEVTVGILDGRALGALEVVAKGEFHTYDVKYTAGREEFYERLARPIDTAPEVMRDAVETTTPRFSVPTT